jgi:hypothetical protein
MIPSSQYHVPAYRLSTAQLALSWWPAVAVVLTTGFMLRVLWLARDELWFDEAFSALIAVQSPGAIVDELRRDSSPPLYYFLLHFWQTAVGAEPAALRAVSVACGIVAIYQVAALGRILFGARVGLQAALLLGLSPLHIYYSREARPYSLLIVFVLWSLTSLAMLRQGDHSRTRVALFCLATVCAAYTHNYGLLLLLVLAVWIARGWVPVMPGCVAAAIVLLAYAPWLYVLLQQVAMGAAGWVARIWESTPPALALLKSFAAFCIGGAAPDYILLAESSAAIVHWVAYVLFALLVGRALIVTPGRRNAARVALAITILLGVPYLVSFAKPVYVVARYDLVALPLFLIVAASGTAGLGRSALLCVNVSVLSLALVSIGGYYSRAPVEEARAKASLLSRHAQPNDLVLCTGFTRNALEYYVERAGRRQVFYSYPASFGRHRGWIDERELADAAFLARDADVVVTDLATTLQPRARLWIAHTRLLREANDILMHRVERTLRQVNCPGDGESQGFTCWTLRSPTSPAMVTASAGAEYWQVVTALPALG